MSSSDLDRAATLLQLQQELIEHQQQEITILRLERDEALRTRFVLTQITEQQRGLLERLAQLGVVGV